VEETTRGAAGAPRDTGAQGARRTEHVWVAAGAAPPHSKAGPGGAAWRT
jgi:hypothetical protein